MNILYELVNDGEIVSAKTTYPIGLFTYDEVTMAGGQCHLMYGQLMVLHLLQW